MAVPLVAITRVVDAVAVRLKLGVRLGVAVLAPDGALLTLLVALAMRTEAVGVGVESDTNGSSSGWPLGAE